MTGSFCTLTRLLGMLITIACLFSGCSSKDEVRSYQVPNKEDSQTANEVERSEPENRMPSGHPSPTPQPSQGPPKPTFTKPDGWVEAAQDGFSQLAFSVGDEEQSLRITVSLLSGNGGGALNNINRWRGQVGLPAMDEATFEKDVEKIEIQGIEGYYIEATTPDAEPSPKAIFGWIGVTDNHAWFIKLRGDASLAKLQSDSFRAFLKSIKFDASDGAGDEKQ